MIKYTCIIIDDEPLARQIISIHVAKIPYLEIVASCQNAIEGKTAIQQYDPDIVFLDIEMPNINGFDLLKMLNKKPAIVLTTAYAEYAVQGFDLDVIDYILKPFEYNRFLKSVQKCITWINKNEGVDPSKILINTNEFQTSQEANYLFVKADYKHIKVMFDDILFVEALQKYVRIHTAKERLVTLMSMSQLERMLPSRNFIRIHRSTIVNFDKIKSVEGNVVTIEQFQLVVSKGQKEDFMKRMKL